MNRDPRYGLLFLGRHLKTGQRRLPRRPPRLARKLRSCQVSSIPGPPAPGPALEDVGVVEQAVEHGGDSGIGRNGIVFLS
jgi:hypothetical protein